jgi:hypothetical protein
MTTTTTAPAVTDLHGTKCNLGIGNYGIHGLDHTDQYNLPSFYTKGKRGVQKAWIDLVTRWRDDMTMSEAIDIVSEHGVKTHYYCAMD